MSYIKADNKKEQRYFDYLEDLRQSGATNMFGASQYLEAAFRLSRDNARDVLTKWMKYHGDPSKIIKKPVTKEKVNVDFVTEARVSKESR